MSTPLVALLAGVLVSSPPRTSEDAQQAARALFRRGNESVRQQAYDAALRDYRAAYTLWPSPKILLNTGTMLQLLGRMAEAAETYARYLADPGADAARREEVEALVAKLDLEVVRLQIEVDPYPAEISIDGVPAGVAAPQLGCRVEPGAHVVQATFQDSRSALLEIAVSAGESRQVELRLAPPAPAISCTPSLAPPKPAWISAAVSLLAVGAGAYFGTRALDDSVDYGEARSLAARANVAYGVAAVSAVVAGGSWIWAAQPAARCD